MPGKFLLLIVTLLSICKLTTAQTSGVLLYSEKERKFKVTANGVLQNDQPRRQIELCCFAANPVKIKVDFGNDSIIEGSLNLKPGFIEHYIVTSTVFTLDSYEEMPVRLEKVTGVSVINTEGNAATEGEKKQRCSTPVSEETFNEIYAKIKLITMDLEQLKEAQFAVRKDCFSALQVKHMLSAFTHESSRLEFAKYAYDYVLNKGGYSVVDEGFSNTATVAELDKYIESKK